MKVTYVILGLFVALVLGLGGGAAATYLWLADRDVFSAGERTSVRYADEDVGAHGDSGHDHVGEDQRRTRHAEPGHEEVEHTEDDHSNDGTEDAHDHGDLERGDGHDEHAAHDEQGSGPVVRLSDEDLDEFGIKLAAADYGTLKTSIRLPGEVVLNADRVAHIVPRAPGIVRQVFSSVGDTVRAGEVMAWLESAQLGEAKVDYLAKSAELGCCTIDLKRAQEVHDNTMRLLETLKSSPSLETLRDMSGVAMGENRSELVSAYAELVFSQAAYQRERSLFERKITSQGDYQAAEAEYKKADALYAAKRDSIEFGIRRDLLEATRAQQVREMELRGAERRLGVLGLTAEDIEALELLPQSQTRTSTSKAECSDPNCKDCARHAAKGGDIAAADLHAIEERLAWYPLRAPFDSTVIDKHLTLGERHGEDSNAFTIADLSSVWVDISVYQKDLSYVKKGQSVRISASANNLSAHGAIAYLAPIVDEKTRTTLARVVLPNRDGEWRPGLFVTAELSVTEENGAVVIPKAAVQRMAGHPVVFIETDEGLKPAPVSLGRSNTTHVEVVSGLLPGHRYVAQGAFELKAKIVTGGLGAHAGHGH